MADLVSTRSRVRFGVFELDLHSRELRKSGFLIHLSPQPLKVLVLLVSHPGELVTREELRNQIWGSDTYVDFEHGLNFAIARIRDALGDDSESPRYVETLPRRGYRFIASVQWLEAAEQPSQNLQSQQSSRSAKDAQDTTPGTGPHPDGFGQAETGLAHRSATRRLLPWAAGFGALVLLAVLSFLSIPGLRGWSRRVLHHTTPVEQRRIT